MPPYTYRPPPGRHQYYESPPPPSAWHFKDWPSALPPDSFYVHTWVTDRVPYDRSPPPPPPHPMSTQTSENGSQPGDKGKGPATQINNGGGTSPRGGGEGSSSGNNNDNTGSRSVKNTEKQIVKVTAPDPNAALNRERRLVEIKLLLKQLHEQIKPAHEYCKETVDQFTEQITSLRDFADKETLDRIWADKQRAEARQRNEAAAKDRQATTTTADFIILAAQINLCLKHLKVAMEETWPRVPGNQGQDTAVTSQVGIVISAVEEVIQLAQDFNSDHYASEDIVSCLEKAQNLTDTDSGLWQSLFKRKPAAGNSSESGYGNKNNGNYGTDHTCEYKDTNETDQYEGTNETDGKENVNAKGTTMW